MENFGAFKENTDITGVNSDKNFEISRDTQNKFDKILDDYKLKNEISFAEDDMSAEKPFLLMDKFEKLFETKVEFLSDEAANDVKAENRSEVNTEVDLPHESNSEYKIGEDVYETDDTGKTYKKNGMLLPDTEYTVNGNKYRTDENGNIVSCDSKPKLCEDGKRNTVEQGKAGGEDRREGDQGGHIIARILGGAEGEENLVPMRETINKGDYKKMELEIKKALEEGKEVDIHIDLEYNDSSRPTKIKAVYTIDGKKTEVLFDNEENSTELLDDLDGKISKDDLESLNEELDDMKSDNHQVTITSVKTEYDENGNPDKVIVGVLDETEGTKLYKVYEAK